MKSSSKAFTAIELIFVIIILGILSSVFFNGTKVSTSNAQKNESTKTTKQTKTTEWN